MKDRQKASKKESRVMKLMLTVVATALAIASSAQEPAKDVRQESVDAKLAALEKKAEELAKIPDARAELERKPEILKKTGGFIDVAAKGVAVLVIDARAKAGGAPERFAEVFMDLSKTLVAVEKTPLKDGECPVSMIKDRLVAAKAAFAVAVVDDERMSGLTVLPEERIAVVNAAKYKEGADPVRREERVLKEIWRGFGFAAGLGYAPFKNDVLQPVFSSADLDANEYQVVQPMNFQKTYSMMKKYGVTRARHIPYRLAVREGWAAQPTNDYQKAVWDEVHAMPTKPLKIRPETKKVSE